MRPKSIIIFERLLWLSLVLTYAAEAASFETTMATMELDPVTGTPVMSAGFLLAIDAIGLAVFLLLWFFIARRASNVCKWILIVLTAIGIIALPFVMAEYFAAGTLVGIVSLSAAALSTVYVSFLFRPDARQWFESKGARPVDPNVFS